MKPIIRHKFVKRSCAELPVKTQIVANVLIAALDTTPPPATAAANQVPGQPIPLHEITEENLAAFKELDVHLLWQGRSSVRHIAEGGQADRVVGQVPMGLGRVDNCIVATRRKLLAGRNTGHTDEWSTILLGHRQSNFVQSNCTTSLHTRDHDCSLWDDCVRTCFEQTTMPVLGIPERQGLFTR